MYLVRVDGAFSAAHYLSHYKGKCEKLHGHNYKVRVWVKGNELNKAGMLIDFSDLKRTLKEITDVLDHSLLNEHPFFSDGRASAERIALYIFMQLEDKLVDIPLYRVDVFENEGSMASYVAEK